MVWLEEFKRKREERQKEKSEKSEKSEDRKEKVSNRRTFRLEKINALKEKFYAVAAKRKWLVFMIVAAIAAYLIIFKGGFGGLDIVTKIKGFFG
tara:strand:+ start:5819 stop:6100 length:282 start_codon:yes stop_codon:yes gene_type:complete